MRDEHPLERVREAVLFTWVLGAAHSLRHEATSPNILRLVPDTPRLLAARCFRHQNRSNRRKVGDNPDAAGFRLEAVSYSCLREGPVKTTAV